MSIKVDLTFSSGGGAVDRCGNIWTPTGSPIINSEKTKWNTESYKGISGTNFHTDNPIDFDIGTGDYTLEAWVYSLSKNQNAGIIQLSQYVGGLTTDQFGSICLGGYYGWSGNGSYTKSADVDSWEHYATVRYDGVLYVYVNGKIVNSLVNSVDLSGLRYAVIGNYYNNGYQWNGYIDSIRVANHAVYKKEFVPWEIISSKMLYIDDSKKVFMNR